MGSFTPGVTSKRVGITESGCSVSPSVDDSSTPVCASVVVVVVVVVIVVIVVNVVNDVVEEFLSFNNFSFKKPDE